MLTPSDEPEGEDLPPTTTSPGDDSIPTQTRRTEPDSPAPPPRGEPGTVPTAPARRPVAPTRAATLWVTLGFGTFFLLAVLIFIIQNLQQARVHFVTLQGSLPLGVALLLAAVGGALVALLLGAVRITQLRRLASRHRRRTG